MNKLKKIYCRIFQIGFRIALPILPYREPKLMEGLDSIPKLLQEKGRKHVLLITDPVIHSLGLTEGLEKKLADCGIRCTVYGLQQS